MTMRVSAFPTLTSFFFFRLFSTHTPFFSPPLTHTRTRSPLFPHTADHGPDMRRDAVRRLLPTRVPPVAGSVYLDTGVPFLPPSKIRGSLPAGSSGASTLSFSPDGILIAIACVGPSPGIPSQFSIRIYETHDGCEACMPLEGHSGVINSLDWSPDSSWLLSSSSDGTAYVWALPRNPRSPHLLTTIPTLPHTRLAHPPAADKHSHANGTLFLESARGITTFALNRD